MDSRNLKSLKHHIAHIGITIFDLKIPFPRKVFQVILKNPTFAKNVIRVAFRRQNIVKHRKFPLIKLEKSLFLFFSVFFCKLSM